MAEEYEVNEEKAVERTTAIREAIRDWKLASACSETWIHGDLTIRRGDLIRVMIKSKGGVTITCVFRCYNKYRREVICEDDLNEHAIYEDHVKIVSRVKE
ncbi:MAG: hypothetical protein C4291_14505 [Candidatus Dadabacteria bacterium]